MTSPADARKATVARRAIVLVGPMGAGKTSVGRQVAKALGTGFTDTDKAVTAVHGPVSAIFAEHGEERFRALEREAVHVALQRGGVVALGGGAVLDPRTREELTHHRVVLLTVDPAVVRGRLGAGTRPLVAGDDPVEAWKRIAESRRGLYEEVADVVFDTSHGPLRAVVERVVAWVRAQGQVQAEEQG